MSDAGGAEVASAYVRLRPNSDGFEAEAQGQISGAIDGLGSGIASQMGAIGQAAGAAFATAAGIGLSAAFNFDTIQTQFAGLLGSTDAATQKLKELENFAGSTPFSFESIAGAAKTLQIFGGEAFSTSQNLQRISDAAAVTGADIGSVATIYGRADAALRDGTGLGRMALQLQRLGILTPAAAQQIKDLAKTPGTAAQQMDILNASFDRFSGQAEAASATGKGIFTNLKTELEATSRVTFTPLYDSIKTVGQSLLDVSHSTGFSAITAGFAGLIRVAVVPLNELSDKISAFGSNLSSGPIAAGFQRAEQFVAEFEGKMSGLGPVIAGIGVALGSSIAGKIPILNEFVGAINPVTGAIAGLLLSTNGGRDALGGLASTFLTAAKDVIPAVGQAFKSLGTPLAKVVGDISHIAKEVLPVLANIATGVVIPAITSLAKGALTVLSDVLGFVADHINVVLPLAAAFGTVWAGMALDAAIGGVAGIADALITLQAELVGTAAAGATFLATPIGLIAAGAAVGIGILTAAFMSNSDHAKEAKASADRVNQAIKETGSVAAGAAKDVLNFLTSAGKDDNTKSLIKNLRAVGVDFKTLETALSTGTGFDAMRKNFKQQALDLESVKLGYKSYADLVKATDGYLGSDVQTKQVSDYQKVTKSVDDQVAALGDERQAIKDGIAANQLDESIRRSLLSTLDQQNQAYQDQVDLLNLLAGRAKNVDDATTAAANSQKSWDEATKNGIPVLNQSTDAGLQAYDALRSNIGAQKDLALAQVAAGGSAADATGKLNGLALGLAALEASGKLTKDQYDRLLTTFGLTPTEIDMAVKAKGVETAKADVDGLNKLLGNVTDKEFVAQVKSKFDDNSTPQQIEALMQWVQGYLNAHPALVQLNLSPQAQSTLATVRAAFRANGGIDHYANGGENHVAQIGTGITRIWDEPETGGEAYIPLAASKRDRSLAIWRQTGHELGVQGFASGGVKKVAAPAPPSAATVDYFTRLGNEIEYLADHLQGQQQIDYVKKLRDGNAPFTDAWIRWNSKLESLVNTQSETAKVAAEAAAKATADHDARIAANARDYQIAHEDAARQVADLQAWRDSLEKFSDDWISVNSRLEQATQALTDAATKGTVGGAQKHYNLTLQGNFGSALSLEDQFRALELVDGMIK